MTTYKTRMIDGRWYVTEHAPLYFEKHLCIRVGGFLSGRAAQIAADALALGFSDADAGTYGLAEDSR